MLRTAECSQRVIDEVLSCDYSRLEGVCTVIVDAESLGAFGYIRGYGRGC